MSTFDEDQSARMNGVVLLKLKSQWVAINFFSGKVVRRGTREYVVDRLLANDMNIIKVCE